MMGILTDDVTRLVGEINALRHGRRELMKDLARARGQGAGGNGLGPAFQIS